MKLPFCLWFFLVSYIFVSLAMGDHHVEEGSAISEEVLVCEPSCQENQYCVAVDVNSTACRVNMTSSMEGRMLEAVIQTSDMNDACSPNPCAGDCVCQLSCKHELGYQCVSQAGFIGKNCDIAIPVVSCGESDISIAVSDKFYAEFDGGIGNSVFYVSPDYASKDKCIGEITLDGSFRVEIPLPFVDCGTFVSSDPTLTDQGIPFENKLWINRDTGADFDMPVPVINFTCVYARDYAVTTALQPIIQQDPVRIGRSGKFSVEFSLCKIDSCPAQCPSYLTVKDYGMYTIGQVIHVNVKVITGQVKPDFVATLEQMFLSCSNDPFSSSDVLTTMASGGCQRPNQVFKFGMRSGDESSPESVCANFQVPKAASCTTIFIHVSTLKCCFVWLATSLVVMMGLRTSSARPLVARSDLCQARRTLHSPLWGRSPLSRVPLGEGSSSFTWTEQPKEISLSRTTSSCRQL